ncbi:FkbM family methyltransferase [Microvirga sp. G4-2]|uniref:FkbM family methyltransferase n=1 Tax=Microvirga sp. G4-2 TaxID=3434467 RepID=UPI00404445C4
MGHDVLERLKKRLADWLGITRLNHAVSFVLMRDVNVLSSAPKGAEGHAALRAAFLHLIDLLKPDVVCDIGALDGSLSLAVRDKAPNCEVIAFEANPKTHARHREALSAHGIDYRNLAVSDSDGRITVHAPRGQHEGKTSLLLRNEEMAYDDYEVETHTLDSLFRNRLDARDQSFFLWIDVEGAAERVLAGASGILYQTLAVFIECETFPFWQKGGSADGVADTLLKAGFVPVARDREYGDKQFNVLFVAGRVAHLLAPSLFNANSPLRKGLISSPTRDKSVAYTELGTLSPLPVVRRD